MPRETHEERQTTQCHATQRKGGEREVRLRSVSGTTRRRGKKIPKKIPGRKGKERNSRGRKCWKEKERKEIK